MLKFTKILLVISWFLFIFIVIGSPMNCSYPCEEIFTLYDKAAHLVLFFVLTSLIIFVGLEFEKIKLKYFFYIGGFSSFLFALLCEYYQLFVPGRNADEIDLLSGLIGIMIALGLAGVMNYQRKPKLLLHICCIACGVYVMELLRKDFEVDLYFFNPNIAPKKEYEKRLEEIKKIADSKNFKIIIGKYTHKAWLKKIKGHEKDREKGQRCLICYQYRMESALKLAKKDGYEYFTTTLTTSPHKLAKEISRIGQELSEKYGVKYFDQDFKKQDGFKKSSELSKSLGLYRQDYCGCEFSLRDSNIKRKKLKKVVK